MMIAKLGRLLAIPLAVSLLSGCPFSPDEGKTPPPVDTDPYQEQTSPQAVMHNLIKAYKERTISEYRKLFDPQQFNFEFSQRDVENGNVDKPKWAFDEDQASTENLFRDDKVDNIVLRMDLLPLTPATEADQLEVGWENVWKITAQNVHLEVHTQDENGPLEYLVDRDGAEFFFRKYPEEISEPSHLPIWRIVWWRDKPAAGLLSFGEMKQRLVL